MGFGIKNNINLDLTYNEIIKPCIVENGLVPFPLYEESRYNAYRCDEICGTTSIDYKFVTCLNGSDIVIADISTMNANAIYELGARHALKPRATILLCAKDKKHEFKFFDITYVPIIFYEHDGMVLSPKSISDTKANLNSLIDFAINSSSILPDNPIQRALIENVTYSRNITPIQNDNIYNLYLKGKQELDDNNFKDGEITLAKLFSKDQSEENLLLLVLGRIKDNGKLNEINNDKQNQDDALNTEKSYLLEGEARERFRKWDNVKYVSEVPTGTNKSKKSYKNKNWGMEIKTNNRLDPKDGVGIRFGVVVTLKEINGVNRIDEFIKNCNLSGWLVNTIDIKTRVDIHEKVNEEIEFQ